MHADEVVSRTRYVQFEHDEPSALECGRDKSSAEVVVDVVGTSELDDDHSSSQSAKRAKYARQDAVSNDTDKENESQDYDHTNYSTTGNIDDDGSEHADVSEDVLDVLHTCIQIVGIDDDGNEEVCGEETNGCSQMCHSCKQNMKRGIFFSLIRY